MPVSRRALLHFMFILSITFVLASVFRLTTIGFAHAASPAAQSQQPSAAPESDDSPGPAAPRPAASVVWVNTYQRLLSPALQPPLWQNQARQIHVRIRRHSRRLSACAQLSAWLDFRALLRQDARHSCTKARDAFHGSAHPPLIGKCAFVAARIAAGERRSANENPKS